MRSHKLFLTLLTCLAISLCVAQEVPENVENAFKQNFAMATNESWEMENENLEAEFKQDGKEMSAVFISNAE